MTQQQRSVQTAHPAVFRTRRSPVSDRMSSSPYATGRNRLPPVGNLLHLADHGNSATRPPYNHAFGHTLTALSEVSPNLQTQCHDQRNVSVTFPREALAYTYMSPTDSVVAPRSPLSVGSSASSTSPLSSSESQKVRAPERRAGRAMKELRGKDRFQRQKDEHMLRSIFGLPLEREKTQSGMQALERTNDENVDEASRANGTNAVRAGHLMLKEAIGNRMSDTAGCFVAMLIFFGISTSQSREIGHKLGIFKLDAGPVHNEGRSAPEIKENYDHSPLRHEAPDCVVVLGEMLIGWFKDNGNDIGVALCESRLEALRLEGA